MGHQEYALIVEMLEADGPGTHPTAVYGISTDRSTLMRAGRFMCDGSSGWSFMVVPWPLPEMQDLEQILSEL